MSLALRPGWGNIQGLFTTTMQAVDPSWLIPANVGLGIQVPVTDLPVRLAYINARSVWRSMGATQVDYTIYRLMVIRGQVPNDVSNLQAIDSSLQVTQQRMFPLVRAGTGFDILCDWLYGVGGYAPTPKHLPNSAASVTTNTIGGRSSLLDGTMFEVNHTFGDGGPVVGSNDMLSVLWLPMTGVNAGDATPNGTYTSYITLTAWGREERFPSSDPMLKSLPRYDLAGR